MQQFSRRSKPPLRIFAALVAPLFSLACGASPEGAEGSGAVEASEHPLWQFTGAQPFPAGAIPVCFKASVPAALRTTVQRLIEESWESAANINFTGWQGCPASIANGTVSVEVDSTLPNNYVGQTIRTLNPSSSVTAVKFKTSSPSNRTVIHEFGHVLGFAEENQADNDCTQRTSGATSLEVDGDVSTSIMTQSACGFTSATLSAWDIIGARKLYGLKHPGTISGNRGLVLNVQGGSTAQATPIVGYQLTPNVWNDRWKRPSTPVTSLLLRANPGVAGVGYRCLNIKGGSVSPTTPTPVVSYACDEAHLNSRFEFQGIQLLAMGNRCVTAEPRTDGTVGVGSKIAIRGCTVGNSRQAWDILKGNRNIQLGGTNLCVNVPGGSTALGTQVELATCSSATSQVFAFEVSHIIFAGSVCLNVLGGSAADGSRIGIYNECLTGHQNEVFTARGQIRGLTQCIDMNTTGTPSDGVPIAMKPCSPAATQIWEYYW